MTAADMNADLPEFLRSPEGFVEHLRDQFSNSDNTEKGDSFLDFSCRLLPLCEFWSGYPVPIKSIKKTHDKGVDLTSKNTENNTWFCGQTKFRMREVAEFDAVISKLMNYEKFISEEFEKRNLPVASEPLPGFAPEVRKTSRASKRGPGLKEHEEPTAKPIIRFVLCTSSNLETIVRLYQEGGLASKQYYNQLIAEKRLEIFDGPKLLTVLQSIYRQSYILAPTVILETSNPYIQSGNVYVSVVNASVLAALYFEHGSSLFFENIREFLGTANNSSTSKDNVNSQIMETLVSNPDKMLGRNNGITFKADAVAVLGENKLQLSRCSIVNGCQTTMCIVQSNITDDTAKILVKVVAGEDSWGVAKAANYQNNIARIDLELAQHLRPQLVRKAATDIGYGVAPTEENRTISNVLESVYEYKVNYDSMRSLYLGLFSRFPNNLFNSIHSELRLDILTLFVEKGKDGHLMRVLFRLLIAMRRAANAAKMRFDESHADLFKRFFNDDKTQYQCLLAILAACGCLNMPLTDKPAEAGLGFNLLSDYVNKLETVLIRHPDYFDKVFRHAFIAIATRMLDSGSDGTSAEIQQKMYKEIVTASGANFTNLLSKLRMFMLNDESIKEPSFATI